MSEKPNHDVPIANVPAFTCLVYVRKADGNVSARVANLDGIEASADSERAVLSLVIPEFKNRLGEYIRDGHEIPWIDPPRPARDDEQKRIVPVHL